MADSVHQGGRVEPTLDGPRSTHSEWRLPDSNNPAGSQPVGSQAAGFQGGRIVSFFKRRPKPRDDVASEPALERRPKPSTKPAPVTQVPKIAPEPDENETGRPANKGPRRAKLPTARRSLWASPITRRILLLNVVALAIPVIGLLYLPTYRDSLVQSELELLTTEG